MTLEELKNKTVTITVHKTFKIGEDLHEEYLKPYIEEYIDDKELIDNILTNEYDYSALDDVLDYSDYKVTIHD